MPVRPYPIVFLHGQQLTIEFTHYTCDKRRWAMLLVDQKEPDEPYCVASVNLPGEELADDQIFIKNWSENDGVLEALVRAGAVEVLSEVTSGFVRIPKCRLLIEPVESEP